MGSGRIQLQDLAYQDRRVDDLLVLVANDRNVALKLTLFDGQKLNVNYQGGAPSLWLNSGSSTREMGK